MDRKRSEQGNVVLLVVMLIPVFTLFLSLGIDVSHAHSLGVMQKQALEDAAEEVQMRQEEVKFSEHPDHTVKNLVADALERDGFIGRARVTYFERAARRRPGTSEDDERHIVVEVAAARAAGNVFGGERLWPVTHSVVWTMRPYASYRVFRPPMIPENDGGTYGRWFELVFEKQEGPRSKARIVADGSLALSGLSDGARRELEKLKTERGTR